MGFGIALSHPLLVDLSSTVEKKVRVAPVCYMAGIPSVKLPMRNEYL
jgi:hypothetical protein